MTRNLDNRVEAVTPVEDVALREQLRFILELTLADNRRCWRMHPDGSYEQRRPGDDRVVDTQAVLMDEARAALADDEVTTGIACEFDLPDTGILVEPAGETAGEPAPPERTDGEGVAESGEELPEVLAAHRDRWYVPDSATYAYAVRTPDGGREYRKTARGAAKLVERYWN
jgi:polyphosphate kinase